MQFKEAYIKRFKEMEKFIKTLVSTRQEFPLLTESIKLLHDNPTPYHFSNECDLLNRVVLGMTCEAIPGYVWTEKRREYKAVS